MQKYNLETTKESPLFSFAVNGLLIAALTYSYCLFSSKNQA